MTDSEGGDERRPGWLWLWLLVFVVLIGMLLIWAWPARQPPADAPDDVSVVRVEAAMVPAPTGVA